MTKTIVGLFDSMDQAYKAVQELRDLGLSNSDISLVAQDATGDYGRMLSKSGVDVRNKEGDATATGAGIGAVLGGLTGLLVGLGALAIPGIGPVLAAGPLGTALGGLIGAGVGAVGGGVAGGLLGALVDMGVPEEQAQYYAEGVRRGGALVTVSVPDNMADRVRAVFDRNQAVDVEQRAATWRQSGWKGYDPTSQPYTAEQVARERQTYASTTSGMGARPDMAAGMRTLAYSDYEPGYRGHYQTNFAGSGYQYEHYQPAYQYGLSLRNDDRYRGYDWNRLEPEARRTWEQRYPGSTWDQVKGAVRYAWENVKQAVGDDKPRRY